MAENLCEFDLEVKKDFPPEFMRGDIITVDTQANVKVGDYIVDLDIRVNDNSINLEIKQIKNESDLGMGFCKITRRGRDL